MTQKNRAVLNFFDDPARVRALLYLSETICRRHAGGARLKQVQAIEFQVAVAVAILIVAPVRVANLASIHLDRHLIRTGDGVRLFFVGSEVKNGAELDFPLPDWVVRLLDRYILEVRPALLRTPNDWLFPGAESGHKGSSLLSCQIADFTTRELGKRISAHQFRHLAAFLYLRGNPGAYEVVRRLLGHRSIQTTIDFYAPLETADAVRHYDRTILAMKNEPVALETGSGRRRRKPS